MQTIDEFIDQIENLPATPQILPELMKLVKDPDVDSERIVKLIMLDPSLTANVLRISNSAFYRGTEAVSNPDEAVMRLGFKQIYNVVIAAAGATALTPAQEGYGIDTGELWKHSVTAGVAAQLIARDLRHDDIDAFTAGLMHDIGKIVLGTALESKYTDILDETRDAQASLVEAETRILGVNHADVGGRLLERWKFPPHLVDAIRFHHDPEAAGESGRLASIVYLGNLVAYFMGNGFGGNAFAFRGREEALTILGVSQEALPQYMMQTFDNLQMIESILSV